MRRLPPISTRTDTLCPYTTLFLALVGIVERRVGDDDAAHRHGLQPRYGRELARPPDLDVDPFERRLRALGGEFVRDRPARRLGDLPQPRLPVEPVDLVDDAVDVERKVRARQDRKSPRLNSSH